jgi:broad specificity phosphatase PhoE
VLVSHVTPIKTLLCRALLAPPAALFRIHLDVASLSRVDWFADGPALVRSMNDTAHLR